MEKFHKILGKQLLGRVDLVKDVKFTSTCKEHVHLSDIFSKFCLNFLLQICVALKL